MSNLIVSAQIICYINGKVYGKVTDFSWASNTPRRELRGIDSAVAFELAPTTASVSGSMSILRLLNDGGLEGDWITSPFNELAKERYFTILLTERKTNSVIFKADQCSVVTQSWNIPSKGMVTGSFTFTGIVWANESS